jgi:uncharacterized C2H2 Zn-finger protein
MVLQQSRKPYNLLRVWQSTGRLDMPKAKVRKFKCPKCDRTFSMAAHLARHQNTVHRAKSRKRVAKRKVAKHIARGKVRRARRPMKRARRTPRSGATPLLRQMQAYRNDLLAQRAQVISKIDAIDKALAAMGGTARVPARKPARGRRGRTMRPGSLKSYIQRVLQGHGGAMAVKDVTAGVLSAGFRTKNKTLAKSVGIALGQMPTVRKVSRGMFRLK